MAKKKKTEDENLNEEFNDDSLDDISDADDSFGLPDVELEPLDRDEESEPEPAEEAPTEEESTEPLAEQEEEPAEAESETEVTSSYDEDTSYGGGDNGGDDGGDDGDDGDDGDSNDDNDEYKPYVPPKPESIGPKLFLFGLIIVVAGALVWYFMFFKPEQDRKEKAAQEQIEKQRRDSIRNAQAEQERLAAEKAAREAEEQAAAEEEAQPEVGTVTTISERTNRYYVVIASFVDDDLAADYGSKLAPDGVSTTIIPPFGGKQFYRLAIADHGSFAEAQTNADELKGTYGEGLWVLKY